jgi:hypothetical protein
MQSGLYNPQAGLYSQAQYSGGWNGYPSSSSSSSSNGGMEFLQSYYQSVTGSTFDSSSDDLLSLASQYNSGLAGQYPASNAQQFSDPYSQALGQQQQQPGSMAYTQAMQQQQQQQYGGQYYPQSSLQGSPYNAAAQFTAAVADPSSSGRSSSSYSYSQSTGNSPGYAFIKAGPNGVVAGSAGGGYTSSSGAGASYGFSQPYFGNAAGVAVVFMPAAYAPDSPNITYPCPDGLSVGTMITVGIPCGIPLTSVPASKLPTTGGLPAAVDLSKAGVSGGRTTHCGSVESAC